MNREGKQQKAQMTTWPLFSPAFDVARRLSLPFSTWWGVVVSTVWKSRVKLDFVIVSDTTSSSGYLCNSWLQSTTYHTPSEKQGEVECLHAHLQRSPSVLSLACPKIPAPLCTATNNDKSGKTVLTFVIIQIERLWQFFHMVLFSLRKLCRVLTGHFWE